MPEIEQLRFFNPNEPDVLRVHLRTNYFVFHYPPRDEGGYEPYDSSKATGLTDAITRIMQLTQAKQFAVII